VTQAVCDTLAVVVMPNTGHWMQVTLLWVGTMINGAIWTGVIAAAIKNVREP
jgi:ABC-type uncharacterized transport system permease subunit